MQQRWWHVGLTRWRQNNLHFSCKAPFSTEKRHPRQPTQKVNNPEIRDRFKFNDTLTVAKFTNTDAELSLGIFNTSTTLSQ